MQQKGIKPFIKWAGGKTQLLPILSSHYPANLGTDITRYVEPFVGGGAVLLNVLSNYQLNEVFVSDINGELINAYKIVRDKIDDLLEILERFQNDYYFLNQEERSVYYYRRREEFNNLILENKSRSGVKSAATLIFLNHTCFNGLYRTNKSGLFNVPVGRQKRPSIYNKDNLLLVSRLLKNVHIECKDYLQTKNYIDSRTFVYLDPPYRPITGKDNFREYNEKLFDESSQKELAGFFEDLDSRGAYILMSNSEPNFEDPYKLKGEKSSEELDNFFINRYADYEINRILAKRRINSKAHKRGEIYELLIKNY